MPATTPPTMAPTGVGGGGGGGGGSGGRVGVGEGSGVLMVDELAGRLVSSFHSNSHQLH